MHVHFHQFDPNIQLNALNAAARAEAKRAAERTRKRLLSAASALAGEYEYEADCVVSLSGNDASREDADQRSRQNRDGSWKQNEQASSVLESGPFSGWA